MTNSQKRSARIIMTNEARVLKDLRLQYRLSMKKAGTMIGRSDSYIAHLETGRMDIPQGERLDRILSIYGGIKQKSFYERVRNFEQKITAKDELIEIIGKLPEQHLKTLLTIATSF